jgi:hypothetical protein
MCFLGASVQQNDFQGRKDWPANWVVIRVPKNVVGAEAERDRLTPPRNGDVTIVGDP